MRRERWHWENNRKKTDAIRCEKRENESWDKNRKTRYENKEIKWEKSWGQKTTKWWETEKEKRREDMRKATRWETEMRQWDVKHQKEELWQNKQIR